MGIIIETVYMQYSNIDGFNTGNINELLKDTGVYLNCYKDVYNYWKLRVMGNPFHKVKLPNDETCDLSYSGRNIYINLLVDTDNKNIVISEYADNLVDPSRAFNFFYGTTLNGENICYCERNNTIFSSNKLIDYPFNCENNNVNEELIINAWDILSYATPYKPSETDIIPMRIGMCRMKNFYISSKPVSKYKEVYSNGHIYKCIDYPRRILYRTV